MSTTPIAKRIQENPVTTRRTLTLTDVLWGIAVTVALIIFGGGVALLVAP